MCLTRIRMWHCFVVTFGSNFSYELKSKAGVRACLAVSCAQISFAISINRNWSVRPILEVLPNTCGREALQY